jgi:hypothetical protein
MWIKKRNPDFLSLKDSQIATISLNGASPSSFDHPIKALNS